MAAEGSKGPETLVAGSMGHKPWERKLSCELEGLAEPATSSGMQQPLDTSKLSKLLLQEEKSEKELSTKLLGSPTRSPGSAASSHVA